MAIDRKKGEMPPKMSLSTKSISRPSSSWSSTYVSICRLLCWAFLCPICLCPSQVNAAWEGSDRDYLHRIEGDTGSISVDVSFIESSVDFIEQYSSYLGYPNNGSLENEVWRFYNAPIIDSVNQTSLQLNQRILKWRETPDYGWQATIHGLLGGWLPQGEPVNVGGTNGIYSFTQKLSDALTDTNSVFHRQLTVQESITNQLETIVENLHLLSYQLTGLTINDITEPLPSYTYYTNYLAQERLSGMEQYQWFNNSHVYDLVALLSIFGQDYLFEHETSFWGLANDYMANWNLDFDSKYNSIGSVIGDLSEQLYSRYGNQGQIITNLLNLGSDIEQEDNFEDGIDTAQDYYEEDVPQYESQKDSRINTDFLADAEDEFTSTTFSDDIYYNFKESFKTFMKFDGDGGIKYEFSISSSAQDSGSVIEVEEINLLEGARSILAQKKSTVDFFIRIILRITQAACFSYLFVAAFKRVNEIFST